MDYGPFFDQEPPEAPIKGLIANIGGYDSYELEATAVFKCVGKGYLVVDVSGSSCWPDYGSTSQTYCKTRADVEKPAGHELFAKCREKNWAIIKV